MIQTHGGAIRFFLMDRIRSLADRVYLNEAPSNTKFPYAIYTDGQSIEPALVGDYEVMFVTRTFEIVICQRRETEDLAIWRLLIGTTVVDVDNKTCFVKFSGLSLVPPEFDDTTIRYEVTATMTHPVA